MTDTASGIPRLSNDLTRSWIAAAFGVPLMVVVPALVLFAPELIPSDNPYALYAGSTYLGWTVFCVANVILTTATFRGASGSELRRRLDATAAPDGRWRRFWWGFKGGGAISWACAGSAVALLALLEVAISGRGMPVPFVIAGVAVVPASVAVIVTTFAVSHARADRERAFRFPGTESPRFDDYVYLSIQLTATFGTSDVEVASTRLRRAVSVHSLLAFAYNAVIVALLVSVLLSSILD